MGLLVWLKHCNLSLSPWHCIPPDLPAKELSGTFIDTTALQLLLPVSLALLVQLVLPPLLAFQ